MVARVSPKSTSKPFPRQGWGFESLDGHFILLLHDLSKVWEHEIFFGRFWKVEDDTCSPILDPVILESAENTLGCILILRRTSCSSSMLLCKRERLAENNPGPARFSDSMLRWRIARVVAICVAERLWVLLRIRLSRSWACSHYLYINMVPSLAHPEA